MLADERDEVQQKSSHPLNDNQVRKLMEEKYKSIYHNIVWKLLCETKTHRDLTFRHYPSPDKVDSDQMSGQNHRMHEFCS